MDWEEISFYICTPQERECSLRNWKNEQFEINSKIISKRLVGLKKMLTFAPAKRKNGDLFLRFLQSKISNRESKIERHVHRHIGLTAVSMETLKQKKRE